MKKKIVQKYITLLEKKKTMLG